MLTCNVVTVQHRKHTDSGKIYIQARTSRKDIFLLFGNEDSKFHNCTTELLSRRNCIFFFLINRTQVLKVKVSHANISYQNGQTCQHLMTHLAGKMGQPTDMLNLAIKRCHNHNNPSVTTFLRGKNKHTEENAWVLAHYQYLISKLYFCILVIMQWV